MIYSERYSLLFVSVPKTATTALTETLILGFEGVRNRVHYNDRVIECGEHWTLEMIAGATSWNFIDSLHVVGGVRNPWDRMVSAYNFYRSGRVAKFVSYGRRRKPSVVLNVLFAKMVPFSIWIRIYSTKECFQYLCDSDNNLRVDTILYMESLGKDFTSLCDLLGVKHAELNVRNKTVRDNYQKYYRPRDIGIISRKFSRDVKSFTYRF